MCFNTSSILVTFFLFDPTIWINLSNSQYFLHPTSRTVSNHDGKREQAITHLKTCVSKDFVAWFNLAQKDDAKWHNEIIQKINEAEIAKSNEAANKADTTPNHDFL